MSDFISRQQAIEHWRLIIDATSTDSGYSMGFIDGLEFCISHLSTMPSAQPEPAIPLSWIEGQIKWLKSMDNAFATLSAEQISALVNKWKDEQDG